MPTDTTKQGKKSKPKTVPNPKILDPQGKPINLSNFSVVSETGDNGKVHVTLHYYQKISKMTDRALLRRLILTTANAPEAKKEALEKLERLHQIELRKGK